MIGREVAAEAFEIVADILMTERDVTSEVIADLRPIVTKTPWHFGVLATWFMFLYQTCPEFRALVGESDQIATDAMLRLDLMDVDDIKH